MKTGENRPKTGKPAENRGKRKAKLVQITLNIFGYLQIQKKKTDLIIGAIAISLRDRAVQASASDGGDVWARTKRAVYFR